MGGRRRRPLPGHLCARGLQPRDHDPRRAARAQRGPREPAELARAQAADRGRGRHPTGGRGRARLPPRARHPPRHGHPGGALSRPRRSRDHAAQPPLREHGAQPPRGHRVDAHGGELVGARRGRLRARRAGDERRRGALRGARGTPSRPDLTADVRARGDRAEGGDAAIEPLHQRGGAHAGVRGSRTRGRSSGTSTRWRTTSSRSCEFEVRQGAPGEGGEDGGVLLLARPGHERHAGEGGHLRAALPGLRRVARAPRVGLGRAVAGMRRAPSRRRPRAAPPAPAHLPRAAGLLTPHGRHGRRRSGSRAQRRGLPGTRVLGRALHLSVPQPAHAGGDPRPPDVPLPAPGRSPCGGPGSRIPRCDVPLAERQRGQGGDPADPPQPALRALGARPQPQPAACERRDLLQHLALLPGHRTTSRSCATTAWR